MKDVIIYPEGYKPNIAYQVYANHKQIVALRQPRISQGNVQNLNNNKQSKIRCTTKTQGIFSENSRRRLSRTIYNWTATVFLLKKTKDFNQKNKGLSKALNFSFITLTLPSTQQHSDLVIKERLSLFFKKLNRHLGYSINWIWRAETHENGSIHFHLLVDHYFPQWYLNLTWIESIQNLDYCGQNSEYNPVCVYTVLVKSMHSIWNYLQKYCAKNSYGNRRGIEGRCWGCSDSIRGFAGTIHEQFTCDEWYSTISKAINTDCAIKYVNEFVTIIYLKKNRLSDITTSELALHWLSKLKDNFSLLVPVLIQYKHIRKWTTDDYYWKNFNKNKAMRHSDDTLTDALYQKHLSFAEDKHLIKHFEEPKWNEPGSKYQKLLEKGINSKNYYFTPVGV